MMFDIAKADDMFGYIHVGNNGQIAKVGTLCKVVDRKLQEDGRQLIALFGVGRFTVNKIMKTLPYVLAEVELDLKDDPVKDEAAVAALEKETYNCLKYYMRLMRVYSTNKDLVISQSTKKHRPTTTELVIDNNARRTDFSFSLANMIQMTQRKETQLLLQTTDIVKRLRVEKHILAEAAQLVADQLFEMKELDNDMKEAIRIKSFRDDFDADILPADFVEKSEEKEQDEWDISNIV